MKTVCVGERVDWIAAGFRVDLDTHVMREIERSSAVADRHGRSEVTLEREGHEWEAHVKVATKTKRLLTSDKNDVRVTVDPRAPDGNDTECPKCGTWGAMKGTCDKCGADRESKLPGWTVGVEVSGETLIRAGWTRALRTAHEIATLLGKVHGARLRRLDLCADFVGFPIYRDDAHAIVSRARARKVFFDDPKAKGAADWSEHVLSGKVRTLSLAPGAPLSARIYDKTYELHCKREKGKAAAEVEAWTRRALALPAHKQAAILKAGADVTRVEFQARGEVLKEMGLRSATAADVAASLDRVWGYCTTRAADGSFGWMRIVDRGTATRKERAELDARWVAVQAVRFRKEPEPIYRVRRSTGARSAQVFGCAVSLLAAAGALPRVPLVTHDGEIVRDVHEMLKRVQEMPEEDARRTVSIAVEGIMRRASKVVIEDFLGERKPRPALEHVFAGWGATMAKVQPKVLPKHREDRKVS